MATSKSCLLLVLLSQAGIFLGALTVISWKADEYTVTGAVEGAALSSSLAVDWNASTSRNRGLSYISLKDLEHLRSGRESAGNAGAIILRTAYDDELVAGDGNEKTSFNCSLAASGVRDQELSPWCTLRRSADTVDVELLSKSTLLPKEVQSSTRATCVQCDVLHEGFEQYLV